MLWQIQVNPWFLQQPHWESWSLGFQNSKLGMGFEEIKRPNKHEKSSEERGGVAWLPFDFFWQNSNFSS